MPAWTSESTVVKSCWIVAAGSITGEGIAGMGATPPGRQSHARVYSRSRCDA
jgi:hypothetical protein